MFVVPNAITPLVFSDQFTWEQVPAGMDLKAPSTRRERCWLATASGHTPLHSKPFAPI